MVEKKVLDILACPKCKENVKENGKFITCSKCELAFPVLCKVPNMLINDAWDLKKAKKSNFKHELRL